MKTRTSKPELPSLTAPFLLATQTLADNLFADLWRHLGMTTLLRKLGFHKRSGVSASQVVYLLTMWVWVGSESIALFARQSLRSFVQAHKDVLYSFLAREDLNWRAFHGGVAGKVWRTGGLKHQARRVFVLDDSVKGRRGKRLEGVSWHFDHLSGRTLKGQQILTLGVATEQTFLPLDSDLFISAKGAHALKAPFADGRSVEARRYQEAQALSKPELATAMLRRAQRQGNDADALVADAWFGTKTMVQTALNLNLTAILRMKKNAMTYRLNSWEEGQQQTSLLDVRALYRRVVRKHWQKLNGLGYQVYPVDVELSLEGSGGEPQWVPVRLLFVRGLAETDQDVAGPKHWAVFLCTDRTLSTVDILETYALRWSIEVYFKEAKQYLGLLWEQTETFASHLASIHLTAVRWCFLVMGQLQGHGGRVCEVRTQLRDQLPELDFARRLWGLFRALIADALTDLKQTLGEAATTIMTAIDARVHDFFVQALQLDELTLHLEAEDSATMAA